GRATVVASSATTLAFWLGASPRAYSWLSDAAVVLWRALDAPVSALNLLLPWRLQSGVALQFVDRTYCFPGSTGYELTRYLLVAIPTWLAALLFPKWAVRSLLDSARRSRRDAAQRQLGV